MSTQQRVLLVAILASFISFLDGTVVNVALPAIAQEFVSPGGDALALQQWVVDAYLITLGSFILVAGSVSDVQGRRRVMTWGLIGFGITSVGCALAPTGAFLIGARAFQGLAGALLVPSSLALIVSAFSGPEQGRAIGRWTGWTGTAMIVGPLLGGVLVDTIGWRWVFGINVVPIALTLWLLRRIPESRPAHGRRVDVVGAALAAIGLAGPVFALIESSRWGWGSPVIWGPLSVGVICLVAFIGWEQRVPDPMLPPRLFRERNFSVGNLATVAVYGALAFGPFVITLFVQQIAGYSATAAGLALLPVTLVMLLGSGRFGDLAARHGARWFMGIGPLIAGAGYLLMLGTDATANYWTDLFPGVIVFGIGLACTVAPLTSTILAAVPSADAGIGSAVNNAVSRVAGLVVIAFAGLIVGDSLDVNGLHRGLIVTAVLLVLGGLVSLVGIRDRTTTPSGPRRRGRTPGS